jgi:hypothetical protein
MTASFALKCGTDRIRLMADSNFLFIPNFNIMKSSLTFLACLTLSINSFAQFKILKGTVVNEKGAPLTAATIMLYKNYRYGTSTNKLGEFSLKIPADYNDSVRVTYRGFEDKYETIQGNDSINFVLQIRKEILMNFVKEYTVNQKKKKKQNQQ